MPQPALILEPDVQPKLQIGINTIADAVKPTLGPLPRYVAVNNVLAHKPPELLDNGAAIARRIFQLPDRLEDIGAMILRHTLWRVYEEVGDGTATAAVLFQAIYNDGRRFLAAGGDAMQLRQGLHAASQVVIDELDRLSTPVKGVRRLVDVAQSACADIEIASGLGEAFDAIGEYGQLDIRKSYGRGVDWETVDGVYWERGIETRQLLEGAEHGRVAIADAAVLISDLQLDQPQQLAPVIMAALQTGHRGLLLIAAGFSEEVKAFLLANRQPDKFSVIAVRTPFSVPDEQLEAMEDIAILTGGKPIVAASGQRLASLRFSDLGRTRLAWASKALFGFSPGAGDPVQWRGHVRILRAKYQRAAAAESRKKLGRRLAKLMGGSATMYLGGAGEKDFERRRELAEQAALVIRSAIRDGLVPGGGTALLHCKAKLLDRRADGLTARAANAILADALEMPTRIIAGNSGLEAGNILGALAQKGSAHCFDARAGCVLPVEAAGIYDVTSVVKSALMAAVSGAAQALTVEAVVHHRDPEITYEP